MLTYEEALALIEREFACSCSAVDQAQGMLDPYCRHHDAVWLVESCYGIPHPAEEKRRPVAW